MRVAIYDPYLDTVGGGERYAMTFAYILAKHGWEVDVRWHDSNITNWLSERLGLDLSEINVVEDIDRGSGYDLTFWLSDGSIPTLFSKRNILHFQTPFKNVGGKNLFNRLKLVRISAVVCNSKFTKRFIDEEYGVKSKVIYPPVLTSQFKPRKKEDLILFVGRFSQLQQAKRQDVLIDMFKELCGEGLNGWQLVIAGGSEVGRTKFVDELKASAEGYPISILENLPFSEIRKFYGRAKIFWSASGFGADEGKEPEKVEHFGITVVEAMAAGCVPIVLGKGGHREIVKDGEDGFLWDSVEELKEITFDIAKKEGKMERIAVKAQRKAQEFSQQKFEKEIMRLISE